MGKGIHLTEVQKDKFVLLSKQGITQKHIGERFDVSTTTAWRIIREHGRTQ